MSLYLWPLVIFVTFGVLMIGAGFLMARDPAPESRADRLADPEPMPGEIMLRVMQSDTVFHSDDLRFRALTDRGEAWRCQRCGVTHSQLTPCPGWYGPFPADTGPLLIMSEHAASMADLEREVERLSRAAERKIGRLQP